MPVKYSPDSLFFEGIDQMSQSDNGIVKRVLTCVVHAVAVPAIMIFSVTYNGIALAVKTPLVLLRYTIGFIPTKEGRIADYFPEDSTLKHYMWHAYKIAMIWIDIVPLYVVGLASPSKNVSLHRTFMLIPRISKDQNVDNGTPTVVEQNEQRGQNQDESNSEPTNQLSNPLPQVLPTETLPLDHKIEITSAIKQNQVKIANPSTVTPDDNSIKKKQQQRTPSIQDEIIIGAAERKKRIEKKTNPSQPTINPVENKKIDPQNAGAQIINSSTKDIDGDKGTPTVVEQKEQKQGDNIPKQSTNKNSAIPHTPVNGIINSAPRVNQPGNPNQGYAKPPSTDQLSMADELKKVHAERKKREEMTDQPKDLDKPKKINPEFAGMLDSPLLRSRSLQSDLEKNQKQIDEGLEHKEGVEESDWEDDEENNKSSMSKDELPSRENGESETTPPVQADTPPVQEFTSPGPGFPIGSQDSDYFKSWDYMRNSDKNVNGLSESDRIFWGEET
jgi:hypothetical protein